ncbi:hypothetical protein LTR04_003901 [Oleoguttula sp. CCFEE 6159]|nr:hypothetical protein LTR04_003901 [Oleoguttula sp. CCFEE 6159]
MAPAQISNIAMAFASHSAALQASKSRDAGPGKASTSFAATGPDHHHGMLPTPPNSISPNLPPHGIAGASTRSPPPIHVDSDIDLQDAVDHAASQDQPRLQPTHPLPLSKGALSGLDAAGVITPAMLAKHHLPDILLTNGPLAIRHVMAYLTQSVPGFSRIPPAKARRVVVAALENRGGGGATGDIEFEKVGWGRWDAHMKGQPPRTRKDSRDASRTALGDGNLSQPASAASSYAISNSGGISGGGGLQIPNAHRQWLNSARRDLPGSWTGSSLLSHEEEDLDDHDMAEHEADKMSLDGASSLASSSAGDDVALDDADDATDEEDWASIGADALRQQSFSGAPSGGFMPYRSNYARDYGRHSVSLMSTGGGPRRSSLAKSAPAPVLQQLPGRSAPYSHHYAPPRQQQQQHLGQIQESQERDAIAALLKMGSA